MFDLTHPQNQPRPELKYSVCNDHLAGGDHHDACKMIRHADGRVATAAEIWRELERLNTFARVVETTMYNPLSDLADIDEALYALHR